MAGKKKRGARAGAKGVKAGAGVGAWAAPKAARVAGKGAWRLGKAEAKLARRALSSREPRSARYLKYGFFALAGLAIGLLVSRSGRDGDSSSSFTETTGHHAPDAGSPAGQRGTTWGTGTPTGTAGGASAGQTDLGTVPDEHQRPGDPNRTGAERPYSEPSSGPLIGEQHGGQVGEMPVQHEEIENRIRTRIGEDPRTAEMPRVNVEVNDGVAELRGEAPSEEAKTAAGEIASSIEGVREVRNMIAVSS
jgi:hypothetical protein